MCLIAGGLMLHVEQVIGKLGIHEAQGKLLPINCLDQGHNILHKKARRRRLISLSPVFFPHTYF